MSDLARELWSGFLAVTTLAVIVTATRVLQSDQAKLFKAIAIYVILAAGISGFVASCTLLMSPYILALR